ncbi:MAG: oligoendopeptidase F [Clostridiales bacterium]|nr:oligoendopeptidase F [Clostridiales bacterium]
MDNKPVRRLEVAERDTWNLRDIFAAPADWEAEYAAARAAAASFEGAHRGKLGDAAQLLAALRDRYALSLSVERLYCYARMKRDEDNGLTESQALVSRAQSLAVEADTACSFLSPELSELPESYLAETADSPAFADYRVFLTELIRMKPHTLSAREERLIAMSGEVGAAPGNIYDMLCDADMKFPEVPGEDGKMVELTHAGFIPLMMSRQKAVRDAAFRALYQTYRGYASSIPAIYDASVKADIFYARAANFKTALDARLFPNHIPTSVYDNLVASVRRHLPALHRFVARNGRLIGAQPMTIRDVYVPAVEGFDIKLPFEQAYDLVVECLAPLGTEYQEALRAGRAARWIDPYENAGKSPGAYSWGTYDTHPYVLLNYKENLDSLLTIAHEMGHAMHSRYSNAAQPYPMADYSLFVAEVASTVNEVLTLRALMARHTEREAAAFLTYHLLDGFRTTVFRQTMFAEFERASHDMAERGEALTVDALNGVYYRLNADYYASIELDELIAYEWMRIPHFYRSFYVYQYATGFSAAMALAGGILREGAPAVARYLRFLSAGGSVPPLEALRLAGVDMEKPESVEAALAQFDELVESYERLTDR